MSALSPSELGRLLGAQRLTNGAGTGRPPSMRVCPKCKREINARQARLKCPHLPHGTAIKESAA